jgi:hypothetical protein
MRITQIVREGQCRFTAEWLTALGVGGRQCRRTASRGLIGRTRDAGPALLRFSREEPVRIVRLEFGQNLRRVNQHQVSVRRREETARANFTGAADSPSGGRRLETERRASAEIVARCGVPGGESR